VQRGAEPGEPLTRLPSGLADIDALLDGGFPCGRLSEIAGPPSSGRTSIALALLARTTTEAGELAAVVDRADAFDPASAEAAGVDLERLLWAQVGEWKEALRCAERLIETEGIPLVVLDLGEPPSGQTRSSHAVRAATPKATASGIKY
jgi:RecA/RadA recombinase